MVNILLTGFTPFAGRTVNASWVAVSLLQKHLNQSNVLAVEIPVVWGEPQRIVNEAIRDFDPQVIIAMGEGKPGCIQLETLALNKRAQRLDNNDSFPTETAINPDGPSSVKSSSPLVEIRNLLVEKGIPVILSLDAGGFLCEETLYILESQCAQHPNSRLILFVHLPPYGSSLIFKGCQRVCDDDLLLEFSTELFEIVTLNSGFSNC